MRMGDYGAEGCLCIQQESEYRNSPIWKVSVTCPLHGTGIAHAQRPVSVLQEWVQSLSFMQQSVLITACRGPDNVHKDHVAKVLLRWLRRSFLYSAFESSKHRRPYAFEDCYTIGGGSFTGPCKIDIDEAVNYYLASVDELPHHFQLHLMHAAEILGYKHPNTETRAWWHNFYCRLVNDAHLNIETEAQMDKRLGDDEASWRAGEEVVATGGIR